MDESGLISPGAFRPAPLQLDGIVSGRDALSAKKGGQPRPTEAQLASKTPVLVVLLALAALLWVLPTLGTCEQDAFECACGQCAFGALVGKWVLGGTSALTLLVVLVFYGQLSAMRSGEDCWWMQLAGQGGSTQIVRAALMLTDSGPARAAAGNSMMQRVALYKSGQMRSDRAEGQTTIFVGSSTIAYWNNLEQEFAPMPVLNAAFAGSSTSQVNAHFSRLVKRNNPSVIVYYCGTNDLLAGLPAVACLSGFVEFVRLCRESAETRMCPIIYLGINTTPLHLLYGEGRRTAIYAANELVHKYVKSQDTTPGGTVGPQLLPQELAPGDVEAQPANPLFEMEGENKKSVRQDGMASWHAGMVAGAVMQAASMPEPQPAASHLAQKKTVAFQSADSGSLGLSPPPTTQPTTAPLFFVDVDSAAFSNNPDMCK